MQESVLKFEGITFVDIHNHISVVNHIAKNNPLIFILIYIHVLYVHVLFFFIYITPIYNCVFIFIVVKFREIIQF